MLYRAVIEALYKSFILNPIKKFKFFYVNSTKNILEELLGRAMKLH